MGSHSHSILVIVSDSGPAVLQAARIFGCESSVCRLCAEGSHSLVLVFDSDVCACYLAGPLASWAACLQYVVLLTEGSHSHVLVFVSDVLPVCACCPAGCSHLGLCVFSMSSVYRGLSFTSFGNYFRLRTF